MDKEANSHHHKSRGYDRTGRCPVCKKGRRLFSRRPFIYVEENPFNSENTYARRRRSSASIPKPPSRAARGSGTAATSAHEGTLDTIRPPALVDRDTVIQVDAHERVRGPDEELARGEPSGRPDLRAIRNYLELGDIGALHARVLIVNEQGKVLRYRMTSQCASGTGQFLENIARYLGVRIDEVGRLSIGATLLGWGFGKPLVRSTNALQTAEADFRFGLARARENSEAIALVHGESAERAGATLRFDAPVTDIDVRDGAVRGVTLADGERIDATHVVVTEKDAVKLFETPFGGTCTDFTFHPKFAENSLVYLSFAEAGEGDTRGAAVARADTTSSADSPTAISAFSLVELSRALKPHLKSDASIVSIGISSQVTASNYGYMSPIKAALESASRFLAKSFSADSRVRFNSVNAGPLKTSASAGIPGYLHNYLHAEKMTFRKEALKTQEVADTAVWLLSPRSIWLI